MPKYTIIENPPPFKNGISTTTSFKTSLDKERSNNRINNNLIDIPLYRIVVNTNEPKPTKATVINTTTINQDITIINEGNTKVSAQYYNTSQLNNITVKTQLINDGLGVGTYDDNTIPIWSTLINQINCSMTKKFIEVVLRFTATTDTLGGAFELEVNNGLPIEIKEENINIQDQDFNIRFKVITNQDSITNGIKFFIKPELGMKINITNFSILIIKE